MMLILDNHIEKMYKISFLWKKMRPESVVCSREQSSKSLKRTIFKKKFFQLICADMLQKFVQEFFNNK